MICVVSHVVIVVVSRYGYKGRCHGTNTSDEGFAAGMIINSSSSSMRAAPHRTALDRTAPRWECSIQIWHLCSFNSRCLYYTPLTMKKILCVSWSNVSEVYNTMYMGMYYCGCIYKKSDLFTTLSRLGSCVYNDGQWDRHSTNLWLTGTVLIITCHVYNYL